MLRCSNKSYYTGITNDIKRRLYEHNSGKDKFAFTYNKRPVKLVWFQEFTDVNEAINKEKKIKGWSRIKKEALIEKDWDKLVKYSKNYTEFGKPT